ncbi:MULTISPECIES: AMP-binding protein [unclassified Nocardia]|uniref:AMP-binding protein n=1 Tax=unclassified Nocardia TaxID=2637762 RepID=UPI0033B3BD0D
MPNHPIVAHLRGFDDRIAVLHRHPTAPADTLCRVTYAQLADRVAAFSARLGPARRLVALTAGNDLDSLVAYLGALDAGCVVLLTGELSGELAGIYDPDVVVDHGRIVTERAEPAHELHPELALLLSTSGSTGSPKLVRLSAANLLANADSIARYLEIGPHDRAATTLPLFYCYGLSVVHSHLLRGASLLLTERSVLDPEFWAEFRAHRATSFAAVPYTVDLLDRIGFAELSLPDLRYVTQAGGKLEPARVRAYARLGAAAGWRFFVMYGQTEATARMAYLPPDLVAEHPECIGIPVPGGHFTLEPVDDGAAEELVYHGPNVMLGYATHPAELALGRTVTALRTGDLARRTADGLYQVIGRRSRFAKLFGLRIDLGRIESELAAAGFGAACTDDGARLIAAVTGRGRDDPTALIARVAGLPAAAVAVTAVDELPRLANGKIDYPAIRALLPAEQDPGDDVRSIYADALALPVEQVSREQSFVELGGNSLSYVTTAARLERVIGRLPADWPQQSIDRLERTPRARGGLGRALDTSTALRAIGIVLVLGSHIQLFEVWGAAHVLLAVAGYNFARFSVSSAPPARRLRHTARTVAMIAVPTALWVLITMVWQPGYYSWQNVLLLNKILGPRNDTAGHLWFLEVLVYCTVAAALLLRIPWLDRWERRGPFWFALALLGLTLVLRWHSFGLYPERDIPLSPLACWYFVLGWAGAKATAVWQRLIVSAVLLASVPGYFGVTDRERLVMAGILLLVWLPALRVPAVVAVVAVAVADSSLFAYLLHWQVYPAFGDQRLLALFASLAAGAAATRMVVLCRRNRTRLALQGQYLGGRLVRQLRDQQVTRNRLAGKVIE